LLASLPPLSNERMESTMKLCTACNTTKPFEAFSKQASAKDGLQRQCKACKAAYLAAWQRANPERVAAYDRACRERNLDAAKAREAKWRAANKDKVTTKNAKWYKENPAASNAKCAKRRAAKLRATPPWADLSSIKKVYERAETLKALGFDVSVDHIVPLNGEGVCGLHVAYNLQVVLASDNSRKKNHAAVEIPALDDVVEFA
jgi:hypothetical protein